MLHPSGRPFTPLGFNYDHDAGNRLLEDYWEDEWDEVVGDFEEMRGLGANVVRVHLQFGKFMNGPDDPDEQSFDRLGRVVALAERLNLYLDLTGLACYRKADVPAWYDGLSEPARWAAQARFWAEVARRFGPSPAVFCYDLMNEPVVPGKALPAGAWLPPETLGGYHFVQYVALDPAGRRPEDISREWVRTLTAAIRRHDRRHLITVGLLTFGRGNPGGPFSPKELAGELDFVSVHVYPRAGRVDESVEMLRHCEVGKPLVVEETFPLHCGADELRAMIERSSPPVDGWVGFYWGTPPQELRQSREIRDALMLGWLEVFEALARQSRSR
jgi:hypothetical protein